MKEFLLYTTLSALFPLLLFAQAPDTLWTRTYGGAGDDVGNSIKQTSDGGYIIAGYTESLGAGQKDVWLLKTDENGEIEWTTTWGSAGDEWAEDVHQTTDGGYIILAHDFSSVPSEFWLIKTSNMGYITWTKSYTCYSFGALGYDIQQTSDGGYIITGGDMYMAMPDLSLYKTDTNGDTVWHQNYASGLVAVGYSVCETFDGGYIIGGEYTDIPYDHRAGGVLLKTDADGNELWRNTYSGVEPMWSVRQMVDCGYIACGGGSNLGIVRTNADGEALWTKTYGTSIFQMRGYSLDLTNDNSFVFTGPCGDDVINNPDGFIFKTDENGDSLWCVVYGDSGYADVGKEVLQTDDGGYIIVGSTESYGAGGSDVWIIKTAPDVSVEEQLSFKAVDTHGTISTTIFRGPLQLPEGKNCKVFDITGRVAEPTTIAPGIYFLELENKIVRKVVKVK